MLVRALTDDIEVIYELSKKLIDTYENVENIDYEKVLRWVRLKIEKCIREYTCILHEGKKVGYYHLMKNEDGTYEIDDLFVFEKYQNQGIGTKVIKECCSKVDGPVRLYVFIKNERAISLYKKLGFRIMETIRESRYIMRYDKQPDVIRVTDTLRLKKYDGHYEKALPGYQDPFVYQNSEGIFDETKIPDLNYVQGMCQYLEKVGELYFIEIQKDEQYVSIGDVTIKPENPPIAIWFAEYRGKGIGSLVMQTVINRLKELGYSKITKSAVYKWNEGSLRLHQKLGFEIVEEKDDEYVLERVL